MWPLEEVSRGRFAGDCKLVTRSALDALAGVPGLQRYGFEVRVPQCLGVTPNQVRRWHWSKTRKAVAKVRSDVTAVLSQQDKPELPVKVTMTRCSSGVLDSDGAIGSMKNVRDAIAAWIGVDDSDKRIEWHVEQRKVTRKEAGTVIRIEECGREGEG